MLGPMRRPLPLALLAVVVAVLAACSRPAGPAESYRRFSAAARSGDAETVWSLLSERSRAALDARARELSARAAPGVIPPSGRDLVLGDQAARAPRLRAAVVVRESADLAVVRVEDEAGGKGEVTLVREDGAWRVQLEDAGAR